MNRAPLFVVLCLSAALPLGLQAADPPVAPAPTPETEPARPKDETMALFEKEPVIVKDSGPDLGDFGSDEPVNRRDTPTRGVLAFPPPEGGYVNMDHWHQYDWKFKAKRSGHYQVRLTYRLDHATLGVQMKHGETRLKKLLMVAPSSRSTYIGEIFIPEAGDQYLGLYTPTNALAAGFEVKELALVPCNEGEPTIKQDANGEITLLAKDATTWSETMRYEAKPEKNCLGFWTDPKDFAEWEFEVSKPGKYQVVVTQGCGKENGGSEVSVKLGEQETRFKVEDTGGFQNWKERTVGEIEIKAPGSQRLVVSPVNKTKSAVMDVKRVVLKPVS